MISMKCEDRAQSESVLTLVTSPRLVILYSISDIDIILCPLVTQYFVAWLHGHTTPVSVGFMDTILCPLVTWTHDYFYWLHGHNTVSIGYVDTILCPLVTWTQYSVPWLYGHTTSVSIGYMDTILCPLAEM